MMDCEFSSRKILPAIRKELVISLLKTKKKQKEIAAIIGVTPAAVTQYIKGKRAKIELSHEEKRKVNEIADSISESKNFGEDSLCDICRQIQKRLSKL
jgi:predicted transcriptional regulator